MTQASQVLSHLRSGRSLTPRQASDLYNCDRLAPRILELRKEGYPIETITQRKGKKAWAEYRLRGPVQQSLFGEARP